jgi:Ca2+-binding EF-hand superfamily protein
MSRPFSFPLTRADCERLFKQLDRDADGQLTANELDEIFRSELIRVPPVSLDHRARFFKSLDADENGMLTMDEFLRFVNFRQAELRAVFDDIVRASAGESELTQAAVLEHADPELASSTHGAFFTAKTLKRAAVDAGVSLSDADVTNIMQMLDDRSQDGRITFDEWCETLLVCVPALNPLAVFETWRNDVWLESDSNLFSPARDLQITAEEERRGFVGVLSAIGKSVMSAGVAGAMGE